MCWIRLVKNIQVLINIAYNASIDYVIAFVFKTILCTKFIKKKLFLFFVFQKSSRLKHHVRIEVDDYEKKEN